MVKAVIGIGYRVFDGPKGKSVGFYTSEGMEKKRQSARKLFGIFKVMGTETEGSKSVSQSLAEGLRSDASEFAMSKIISTADFTSRFVLDNRLDGYTMTTAFPQPDKHPQFGYQSYPDFHLQVFHGRMLNHLTKSGREFSPDFLEILNQYAGGNFEKPL